MQKLDTLYTGAAEVGRLTSTIGLVIACLLGGGLLIGGIYMVSTDAPPIPELPALPPLPGMPAQLTQTTTASSKAVRDAAQKQANEDRKKVGYILIGFGVLIILGALIWWYLNQKSKMVAAAAGVGGALDMFF